jgi:hypothetical protein
VPRRGPAGGKQAENFVPRSPVNATPADNTAAREPVTGRAGCLNWARPDLWEPWGVPPRATRQILEADQVPEDRASGGDVGKVARRNPPQRQPRSQIGREARGRRRPRHNSGRRPHAIAAADSVLQRSSFLRMSGTVGTDHCACDCGPAGPCNRDPRTGVTGTKGLATI